MGSLGLGNIATSSLSTVAADPLLEGLGLTARDGESWVAQRTKEVVEILGTRWGMVSRENVERCLERIGGLECLWDEGVGVGRGGKAGTVAEGEVKRTFSIAGNEFIIDIEWMGECVVKVRLELQGDGSEEAANRASKILRKDLVGEKGALGRSKASERGYVSLDGFVENLSRLARIDSLGKGSVSCFNALDGVGNSLKKLYDLEVQKEIAVDGAKLTRKEAELMVLCEKSGRPDVNTEGTIGLKLNYWVDRRAIARKTLARASSSTEQDSESAVGSLSNPYNLVLDCEEFDATQFPSIRISDVWLAETAAESLGNQSLPLWQDPPPTYVPNTETNTGSDGIDLAITTGTLPNTRFVARLNPPVTVPLAAAMEIFNHVGQPILQQSIQSTTYASLLFPAAFEKAHAAKHSSKDAELHFNRTVRAFDAQGNPVSHTLRFNLFAQPDSWARTIHEIPFSHPKQLVDILPYLRQWMFFGKMLQRTFDVNEESYAEVGSKQQPKSALQPNSNRPVTNENQPPAKRPKHSFRGHHYRVYDPPSDTDSEDESPYQIPTRPAMKPPTPPASKDGTVTPVSPQDTSTSVDISFNYASIPRRVDLDLSISFPADATSSFVSCVAGFHIQPDARIEVKQDLDISQSSDAMETKDPDGKEGGQAFGTRLPAKMVREKTGKTLGVLEDLGGVVAWLKMEREKS